MAALQMNISCLIFLQVLLLLLSLFAQTNAQGLKVGFYDNTCPKAEGIVKKSVLDAIKKDRTIGAPLLRMFFHDCFVRGCEGSVLLELKNKKDEKNAPPNLSLRGFEIIDNVKEAVEKECPGVVSCSDVLALVARDAVVALNGPSWGVETGRRDGRVTNINEARANLPSPFDNITSLITQFRSKGLDKKDLVVLSGPDSYVARVWVTKLYAAEATCGGNEERGGAEAGLIGVNGLRSKADRRRDGVKRKAQPHCTSWFLNWASDQMWNPTDTGRHLGSRGGHTVGNGHCPLITNRLYNFTGKGDSDPNLDTEYAANLRGRCKPTDTTTALEMDPGSFKTFDESYFKLVSQRRGFFQSDAALLDNQETKSYVLKQTKSYGSTFFKDFGVSMVKMGRIGVLTGRAGEVRKKCRMVN
uniref:Peroxidase n=1 Tax=Brassica campestris TaxID=3711 RepID=M4CWW8_BRACM